MEFRTVKPNVLACQVRSRPCIFFPCQKIELFAWNLAASLDKAEVYRLDANVIDIR